MVDLLNWVLLQVRDQFGVYFECLLLGQAQGIDQLVEVLDYDCVQGYFLFVFNRDHRLFDSPFLYILVFGAFEHI